LTELLKGFRNLGFPKLPDPLFSCYEFSDEQETSAGSHPGSEDAAKTTSKLESDEVPR